MMERSVLPTSSLRLYAIYLKTFAQQKALAQGQILHARLLVTNTNNHSLSHHLILCYTHCGRPFEARKVLERTHRPNPLSFSVLIGSCSRLGLFRETLDLYGTMLAQGLEPNRFVYPSVLKACANLGDRAFGESVHRAIEGSVVASDPHVECALVDMYAKCGCIDKGRQVFDKMRKRDLAAWNAMISGYANNGGWMDAWGIYEWMVREGAKADAFTWNSLVSGFSRAGDLKMVFEFIHRMRLQGFEPDVVTWTSMISGSIKARRYHEAFKSFRQMMASGIPPNSATVSAILPACNGPFGIHRGLGIHGYSVVTGHYSDVCVGSALLNMYAKCGYVEESYKVFEEIINKNVVAWNSMIQAFGAHGRGLEAVALFNRMPTEGLVPDHVTWTTVLTACSRAGLLAEGHRLFKEMHSENSGVERVTEHYACMVDLLGRAGRLAEARALIEGMPIAPDSYVWGALLGACRIHGEVDMARNVANRLFELEPKSGGSYALLSSIYAGVGRWDEAEEVKGMMRERKVMRKQGRSWIEGPG
ncbi:pentatricopeptide repeat-containing protein At5g59600 [Amborella trichopoda]|uniref:pentatricopeptide repeat-containing protein At5g59600 n=1 Tax=Amborella trichopoda TaxID=13333 RepID=UPI0009C0F77C|nr:pentatricopeptide repeat-containing protein At5g59600 [Amborella trichopoda]|eukprot:XP_011624174.2 pentatricopeptide repeat-containing protein At5g59600 [Amborella trichopoda]